MTDPGPTAEPGRLLALVALPLDLDAFTPLTKAFPTSVLGKAPDWAPGTTFLPGGGYTPSTQWMALYEPAEVE